MILRHWAVVVFGRVEPRVAGRPPAAARSAGFADPPLAVLGSGSDRVSLGASVTHSVDEPADCRWAPSPARAPRGRKGRTPHAHQ